jgi:curved DNA-binding protein
MGCTKPINLVGVQSFTIEIPRRHHPDGEIRGQVTMPNGNPRQVVCKVNPKKHPDFELRGLDLYCTREISLMEHYRGTNIRVKVLDGKEFNVKVPPGKQNPIIKMSGKGFALPNNQAGDLYIEVKVKLPVLDNAQIEQLKNILQKVDVSV